MVRMSNTIVLYLPRLLLVMVCVHRETTENKPGAGQVSPHEGDSQSLSSFLREAGQLGGGGAGGGSWGGGRKQKKPLAFLFAQKL